MLIRREKPGERRSSGPPRDKWASARLVAVGAVLVFFLSRAPSSGGKSPEGRREGGFDYYVLALSWSPGFCGSHPGAQQCSRDEGFVLHGLWPQYEGRGYPSDCSTTPLSSEVRRRYAGLYPDPGLIDHEWTKHGTCSGLDPEAYFQLTERIRKRVTIPAAYAFPRPVAAAQAQNVRAAFRQANPGLPADGVVVTSADRSLAEVRICVTRAGAFRSCN